MSSSVLQTSKESESGIDSRESSESIRNQGIVKPTRFPYAGVNMDDWASGEKWDADQDRSAGTVGSG